MRKICKLSAVLVLTAVGSWSSAAQSPEGAPSVKTPVESATGAIEAVPAAAVRAAPVAETADPSSTTTDATAAGYLLRPGDVLQVSVWKETDLQAEVLVRPDGGISFPLAGELVAAGETVAELTTMLEARIRKFVPDAVVTVTVKAAAGNRIYVVGKVNKPGDFPLIGPMDVMQALSVAGGTTPFADTRGIRVLRREDGHQIAISFRYNDISHGRKLEQNILLQNGDTVVVP